MTRLLPFLLLAGSLPAADPPLADLVKQLGDPRFAVREAAQKELVHRGEGVAPDLERLKTGADAETGERIGKILDALVGYKDDIRRCLAEVHEGKDSAPEPVSDELRGLIAAHQPGSGGVLLEILSDPGHRLHRRAMRTFVATWNVATPDQIDAYVRRTVTLKTAHRGRFPAKFGAMISFEAQPMEGWTSWPVEGPKGFTFRTRTTRYLDGKPYDKPFDYRYPFATVGWYRVGELAEGKHTIHAVLEYEITQHGQKRKGEIRSKDSTFEVVSADTPDDLIAPKSITGASYLRAALRSVNPADPSAAELSALDKTRPGAEPQVRWELAPGKWAGLGCPEWDLTASQDVDLCFDVEIRERRTGKVHPADPIVVPRGTKSRGYLMPRDVRGFAGDRDGAVTVDVTLRPSRALALTHAEVTRYFPETITWEGLRIRIHRTIPQDVPPPK